MNAPRVDPRSVMEAKALAAEEEKVADTDPDNPLNTSLMPAEGQTIEV